MKLKRKLKFRKIDEINDFQMNSNLFQNQTFIHNMNNLQSQILRHNLRFIKQEQKISQLENEIKSLKTQEIVLNKSLIQWSSGSFIIGTIPTYLMKNGISKKEQEALNIFPADGKITNLTISSKCDSKIIQNIQIRINGIITPLCVTFEGSNSINSDLSYDVKIFDKISVECYSASESLNNLTISLDYIY